MSHSAHNFCTKLEKLINTIKRMNSCNFYKNPKFVWQSHTVKNLTSRYLREHGDYFVILCKNSAANSRTTKLNSGWLQNGV